MQSFLLFLPQKWTDCSCSVSKNKCFKSQSPAGVRCPPQANHLWPGCQDTLIGYVWIKTCVSGIGSYKNKHGSPHRAMRYGGGLLRKTLDDIFYISGSRSNCLWNINL